MYERLTSLIPALNSDSYGEWIIDRENDGTPEHPKQFPFVGYSSAVYCLGEEISRFVDEHKDFELTRYGDILNGHGIEWDSESMKMADTSRLDGKVVMALLIGAVRAERFCDGALLGFCKDGSIIRWLKRLKEIDEEQTF